MNLRINHPSNGEMALLAICPGPIWQDECKHKQGSYVTSFEVCNHKMKRVDRYDLYLYLDSYTNGHHICIRYGKECNEYISPGSLGDFLSRNDGVYEPNATAARILLFYGNVQWGKK